MKPAPLFAPLEIAEALWRANRIDEIRRYHAQTAIDEIVDLYAADKLPMPPRVHEIIRGYLSDVLR